LSIGIVAELTRTTVCIRTDQDSSSSHPHTVKC